jgi:hypothetical protein
MKKGAFHRRLVVQFRQSEGDEQAMFSVVAGGEAAKADVVATNDQGDVAYHAASSQVPNPVVLRRLTFQITDTPAHEVKVWAHQVEPDGTCTALPVRLTLSAADGERRVSEDLGAGPVLVPWSGKDGCVELDFRPIDLRATPGAKGWDATMNSQQMMV